MPAWKQLLVAICNNLPYLDSGILPEDWRFHAWNILCNYLYNVPDYVYAEMYHAEMNQVEMYHAEKDRAERYCCSL